MKAETLTSIKLQQMINVKTLEIELWGHVLKFGRKKSGEFKFPIVFKNYKQAEKLYDELYKLKGKTIDEVRDLSDKLYDKFKKYHYKNKPSKNK